MERGLSFSGSYPGVKKDIERQASSRRIDRGKGAPCGVQTY